MIRAASLLLCLTLIACTAPSDGFPGAVAITDGKGVTTWWGCLRLPSGDVREVGSYDDRALLFMPGAGCEIEPELPDTQAHIYITWREAKADSVAPFGKVRLVVAGACPASVTPAARDEAARLIQEFIDHPQAPAKYLADARLAHAAVMQLSGPTIRVTDTWAQEPQAVSFHGGYWGPKRRAGAYLVCETG